VVGLTKSVALEYPTTGIRPNAVAPGGADTALLASGTQAEKGTLASYAAMKRISRPEEIARTILYLLADAHSRLARWYRPMAASQSADQTGQLRTSRPSRGPGCVLAGRRQQPTHPGLRETARPDSRRLTPRKEIGSIRPL
jgi:Enoyl-(Acyl carrier protein) reductase